MEIVRSASTSVWRDEFLHGELRRLAARLARRRRRGLRPMAEGLGVRSLLAVGLDPSFGFGGTALLNLAVHRDLTGLLLRPSNISLQNGQVVAAWDRDDFHL